MATFASTSYDTLARRRIDLHDVLLTMLGLSIAVEIAFGGRLFAFELAALVLLPALALRYRRLGAVPAAFVALGLLWLDGQVMTDIVRGTAAGDFTRGWSKIAMTVSNFVVLQMLIGRDRRRMLLFAAALAVGLVARHWLSPTAYGIADPWKFGYGWGLTLGGVVAGAALSARMGGMTGVAVILCLGTLNMIEGFRSLAGVCFVTAVYLCARHVRLNYSPGKRRRPIVTGGILIVAAFAFVQAYTAAAQRGVLGADARDKATLQADGPLGLPMSGRPEFRVSLGAALDSPLLGHGSWARDTKYVDQLRALGLHVSPAVAAEGLIPTHSHIMGAWVEAGALGLPFWLWVLAVSLIALARGLDAEGAVVVLGVFLAVALVWDVPFSPFGAERRIIVPFTIIVLLELCRGQSVRSHT